MARFSTYQQSFSRGEIDPAMHDRVDLEPYKRGLARAKNVFPVPRGGITRRFGMRYLDSLLGNLTKVKILSETTITSDGNDTFYLADGDLSPAFTITTTNDNNLVWHIDLRQQKKNREHLFIRFKK